MRVLLFLIFAFGLATQGSFIDSRDQQQYTLLTIGSQQWLKENLRFVPSGKGIRSSGGYYSASELKSVCPEGFRSPSVEEWKELIQQMPGKRNSRKGRLVAVASLQEFGLQLGGQERMDSVYLSNQMGFYWTSSDTLKTYYKELDNGAQRHLIGIHLWSSGEPDSTNVEPTYMLAKNYQSGVGLSCKCIKE